MTLTFVRGRVKVMSTIALHSSLNISDTIRYDTIEEFNVDSKAEEPLQIEARFQRTTNRKWPIEYRESNGYVTDDVM